MTIGNQIGVGKESDVFLGQDGQGRLVAVKFHRLGRTSFRSIKRNREYHQHRQHASWLYLSRLAAIKEFAYMKTLYEHGFPVPQPVDVNRHVVVMEYLKGYSTLYHILELKHPGRVYSNCMNLLVELAECGLIHGDFNEFNLMIDENDNIIMIDFPQMVSIDHPNAEYYFNRDVDGIRNFFSKRFGFTGAEYPVLGKDTERKHNLDKQIQASGFTKQLEEDFIELAKENAEVDEDAPDSDEEPVNVAQTSAADPHFEAVQIVNAGEEDQGDDGDDDITAATSSSAASTSQDQENDSDDDDAPPEETKKERRDRLRRKAAERAKAAKEAEEAARPPAADDEPIVPEPGEEGLDLETIRRNRIIRNRVKAQLDRKRLTQRTRARNEFKQIARTNMQRQMKNWADDM